MIEYTKEQWRLGKFTGPSSYESARETCGLMDVVVDTETGPYVLASCNMNFPDDAKANARRIVACVNACAGIPTETLEKAASSVPVKSSLNGYLEMKQQRDELLSAMKKIRPFIDEGDVPKCFWSEPFKSAVADFDAAIEKAK